MMKFIKNIFNGRNKQCNSVVCDGCNDYGYIIIKLGGFTSKMRCPKCDRGMKRHYENSGIL